MPWAYEYRALAFMRLDEYLSALYDLNTLLELLPKKRKSLHLAAIHDYRAECYEELESSRRLSGTTRKRKRFDCFASAAVRSVDSE